MLECSARADSVGVVEGGWFFKRVADDTSFPWRQRKTDDRRLFQCLTLRTSVLFVAKGVVFVSLASSRDGVTGTWCVE